MKQILEQELKDLYVAYKKGDLSTNEYQSIYYSISQKIKKI